MDGVLRDQLQQQPTCLLTRVFVPPRGRPSAKLVPESASVGSGFGQIQARLDRLVAGSDQPPLGPSSVQILSWRPKGFGPEFQLSGDLPASAGAPSVGSADMIDCQSRPPHAWSVVIPVPAPVRVYALTHTHILAFSVNVLGVAALVCVASRKSLFRLALQEVDA